MVTAALAGCGTAPTKTYTAYGTVRSVWLESHSSESRTVIAFAPDSDPTRPIDIEFNSVEPRLWQNMHTMIVYEKSETVGGNIYCPYDGRPTFKITSVEELK